MTRVQIPAYTDRWMMGDRYGEIVKISDMSAKNRIRLLSTDPRRNRYGDIDPIEIAHVKLDKSGKTVRVILADCTVL